MVTAEQLEEAAMRWASATSDADSAIAMAAFDDLLDLWNDERRAGAIALACFIVPPCR